MMLMILAQTRHTDHRSATDFFYIFLLWLWFMVLVCCSFSVLIVCRRRTHRIGTSGSCHVVFGSAWSTRFIDVKMDKKIHVCTFDGCNAKFSRPYRLQQHTKVHNGERPFQCTHPGCNRSYTNNSHLRRHLSVSHVEQRHRKSYKCNFPGCGKQLRHESNLRRHVERCHNTCQRRFSCKSCPETFSKKRQLLTHSYVHTGIPPFKCETCDMGFLRSRLLTKHALNHRVYSCAYPECKAKQIAFTRKIAYRKHRKECHQQKFFCAHCDYSNTQKHKLAQHVIRHLQIHEKNIFSCPQPLCGKFYLHQKNLTRHINVVHQGMGVLCSHPGCGKRLSNNFRLKEHMKLHDPNYTNPRPKPKTGAERMKRKDSMLSRAAAVPKSCAVKLSGVQVPPVVEKTLVETPGYAQCLCLDAQSKHQVNLALLH
ncbi:hypothetical protein B566_EDAN002758 [Ephemera danica]|nr:hypothetical protein B566_EDAN002758 [Ephemera danica]